MDLIKANIENLTSLWNVGGAASGNLIATEEYSVSVVSDSEWPNKLWFHKNPERNELKSVLDQWKANDITIPIWEPIDHEQEVILRSYDFELKNELTGMSICLDRIAKANNDLRLIKVNDSKTAVVWSELFQEAFGYLIHPKTIALTMDKIDYFIGKSEGENIGTAVLFQRDEQVVGIHSMGVVPAHRRKGHANNLLINVLSLAQAKGAKYATLQASSMGKGLYLKTGFSEDFQLKNFKKLIK
ncbi:MAG: GNAT family N-acetyltransferase [Reichenbachiella sp.]|uniref:GNAT family N-acetyltransferase n=1 Tax=Reichenbachiella sp. TaxID=2184521 RepID=UPI0032985DB5